MSRPFSDGSSWIVFQCSIAGPRGGLGEEKHLEKPPPPLYCEHTNNSMTSHYYEKQKSCFVQTPSILTRGLSVLGFWFSVPIVNESINSCWTVWMGLVSSIMLVRLVRVSLPYVSQHVVSQRKLEPLKLLWNGWNTFEKKLRQIDATASMLLLRYSIMFVSNK